MGTETDRQIGELVREARRRLGWSQERLAEEAGVSDATVRKIERGTGSIQPGKLASVRAALGIPIGAAAAERHYDRDIELVRDMVGLWLSNVPPAERAGRVLRMTEFLYAEQTRSQEPPDEPSNGTA